MKTWRDDDGELWARFGCDLGHEFDLGPIHDPEASEPDPDHPEAMRSVPGSGTDEHVPAEALCWTCIRESGDRRKARPA